MPAAPTRSRARSAAEIPAAGLVSSPHGLVVLVCDGALRFLEGADAAIVAGNAEAVAANVLKVQRILLELLGALDHGMAPDATDSLERLYQNLLDRLSDSLKGERLAITETRLVLMRLRNAWLEAERTAAAPTRGAWTCLLNADP
jgi:flagellar protein FliS